MKHPDVYEKFVDGFFVVHKTQNRFSAMALDQAHEQENALVKRDGRAVGLAENSGVLRRWMVAGPEVARIVNEFENTTPSSTANNVNDYEQSYGYQISFLKDILSANDSFEQLGNPFEEEGKDLYVVDTRDVMSDDVVETVKNVLTIGQQQYNSYVKTRLKQRTTPISDPIPKNKLLLFNNSGQKAPSKDKSKVVLLKNDCSLFSRLYIACQNRDGSLEEFFRHENQPWPPSLADRGEMRKGQKADLVRCLEALQSKRPEEAPNVESIIIDGTVAVQMLNRRTARTFQGYSDTVFRPCITKQLERTKRVDIVWDIYKDDSLKAGTREKRGEGTRRRVLPSTAIPNDWHSFLRVDENKVELFHFLSEQAALLQVAEGKEVYTTLEEKVLHSGSNRQDLSRLEPCIHEEADTRIMLHAKDSAVSGNERIIIRTIDTDIVVLSISIFHVVPVYKLWVAFGSGKHFRYLAVHDIATFISCDDSL